MGSDAAPTLDGRRILVGLIDAVLPQTQCRRCGYDDCRAYAEAIADGAAINRCPPGGAAGIERLAGLTGRMPLPLDPDTGTEGPLRLAVIDESGCIGCTLCLAACPVDCIVGAPKRMHSVVAAQCTGCELCLPACPVDCILLVDPPSDAENPSTGPAAWSDAQAALARERYRLHRRRLGTAASSAEPVDETLAPAAAGDALMDASTKAAPAVVDLRAVIEAALARTRPPSA